jgi:hypothetical protein
VALFGYEDESELLGRNSHATTHYQRPDGSPYPVEDCPLLKPRPDGGERPRRRRLVLPADGSMIPVAYSSAPFPMESGVGAVVAIRDMTELRQAEDELRLLQTTTALISAAETLEEAVANVIREVCQESGWVAGEMWIPDDDCARLKLAPGWWAAAPEMEAFFVEASAPQTMGPGEGLAGTRLANAGARLGRCRHHAARRPADRHGPPDRLCGRRRDAGARRGRGGRGPRLLRDHRRTEDDRWTDVLAAIAAQLGPVLLRKRAEDELSRQAIELARSNADLRLFAS